MLLKIGGVPITTEFGAIDKWHSTPHKGLDLALSEGSPLYSLGKGVVENVVNYGSENIGRGVIVKLENGMRVVYGHISEAKVQIGQKVSEGQLLALSGNTGRSTGPHLHLQVQNAQGQLIDPTDLAAAAIEKNSPWVPDFIEQPYKDTTNSIAELNDKIDAVGYWINPVNLVREGWQALEMLITSPDTGVYLMAGTIGGVWLVCLGAKWPKKYIFWGWIVYWTLRGFIFA